MLYYLTSTMLASLIGVLFVNVIRPGDVNMKKVASATTREVSALDSLLDMFRNLFPDNIVRIMMKQVSTEASNKSDGNGSFFLEKTQIYLDNPNFLGIISCSVFFGLVLVSFGERSRSFIQTLNFLNDVIMRMMMTLMALSPVGVFFLILGTLLSVGDIGAIVTSMGRMVLTTMCGLALLWMCVYPLAYFVFTRKNPFIVMYKSLQATLFALMIASSSATLPLTIRCCEENLRIKKAYTRFMLPLGAIINMDGTSVHEAAGALFIAQLNGIELSIGEMLLVSLMGAVSSIACSTSPGSAVIILLIIVTSAGLPTEDVYLFFMTDWFLSRFRTSTNVMGDIFSCAIVSHLCDKSMQVREATLEADENDDGGFLANKDLEAHSDKEDCTESSPCITSV